jgi:hypothetical protein
MNHRTLSRSEKQRESCALMNGTRRSSMFARANDRSDGRRPVEIVDRTGRKRAKAGRLEPERRAYGEFCPAQLGPKSSLSFLAALSRVG